MDKEYLTKRGTIYITDSDDIEYRVGLIKLIDSLKKDNLVCGHKEFIEECKYCWCNCDLEIIKQLLEVNLINAIWNKDWYWPSRNR